MAYDLDGKIDEILMQQKEEQIRSCVKLIEERLWDFPVQQWRSILAAMLMEDASEEIHAATRRIRDRIDGILTRVTFRAIE